MKNIFIKEISVSELKELIRDVLKEELENLCLKDFNNSEEILSREEAAKYLKISLVTLGSWTKSNKIPGYRKGSRVYYKKSELIDCLKPTKR